ncbi:MAG: hypothetical protein WCW03_03050 [Candidatus Paceibacterota bacterium]|jgi:hypothetical protein
MVFIQNWGDSITSALLNVGNGVIVFVPKLLFAVVIFAIGWVLAALVEHIVESIFKSVKVDSLLKSAGFEDVMKRAGHNLNSGRFVGSLCKWFIIVIFLMASFDIMNLTQVNIFLGSVVGYLPNVIVAVLILMVSAVVANAMQKLVVASAKSGQIKSAELAGRIVKWAIWIFAVLTALITLGIAPGLIQMIITAVFAGAALAIGLSFGLGGKEVAQKWIEKTSQHIFEKE